MFDLLESGNIILNFGTTRTDATGLSKPMEYKRIKDDIPDKIEPNYTLQQIRELAEKTEDLDGLIESMFSEIDDYKY